MLEIMYSCFIILKSESGSLPLAFPPKISNIGQYRNRKIFYFRNLIFSQSCAFTMSTDLQPVILNLYMYLPPVKAGYTRKKVWK